MKYLIIVVVFFHTLSLTLEGQIIAIADEIAQITHDLDDYLRYNILIFSKLTRRLCTPNNITIIKSFNVETFLGFGAWEGFLLLAGRGDRGGRVTALGVCQQNIHPCGENVLENPAYFMPSCPWCVCEHILDPSDLRYPS